MGAGSEYWLTLHSDEDAVFDHEVALDTSEIAPQILWGTSEMVTSIEGVPRSADLVDETAKKSLARALEYMGLGKGWHSVMWLWIWSLLGLAPMRNRGHARRR